jgi:hypothetical protein
MSSGGRNSGSRRHRPQASQEPRREPARRRRPAPSKAHKLARDLAVRANAKLVVPARRLLSTAVGIWLALAERAGTVVLAAWRRLLRPLLAAFAALAIATYRSLDRRLTPARGVALVCLVALAALVASQWLDYRAVAIGTDAYSGPVEAVAAAPEVDRARAGDAHAWMMLPLALIGLVGLGLAFAGRPRAARLLIAVGVAVLAIGLIVDAPNGLDEGEAGVVYEGAEATLIEGFWLQIAAAAVLIAAGALLPRYLRPEAAAARRRPRAGRPGPPRRLAARSGRRRKRVPDPRRPVKARRAEGANG